MCWHEDPLPPDQRQAHRKTGTRHTVKPKKPEDGNPSCGESAPSEDNREKNIKFLEKQGERSPRAEFEIGCNPSGFIPLDLTMPEKITALWTKWHAYRIERHHAKGERKLAWTSLAATSAAESVNRAFLKHGEQMVVDRMLKALEQEWKGLNMDTLGKDFHGTAHQKRNSSLGGPAPANNGRDSTAVNS
jgi:hypothetical protein